MNFTHGPISLDSVENLNEELKSKECFRLKCFGSYLLLTCIAGVFINLALLWALFQINDLRKSHAYRFILIIAFNNLLGCIVDMPLQIISAFQCGYIFNISKFRLQDFKMKILNK